MKDASLELGARPGARVPWGPVLAVLLGASLALLPQARADIVLHDGGVSRDRDAAKRVQEVSGKAPTLVLSSDILAGPSRMLKAGARTERCAGSPLRIDIEGKLAAVSDLVLGFELDRALDSIEGAKTLLPCSDRPIASRQLAELAFLEGAARFDLGDQDSAAAAMKRAVVADIAYSGVRGFPKDHLDLLEQARAEVQAAAPATLYVWPGPDTDDVFVNGERHSTVREAGVPVSHGQHLVQIGKNGVLSGLWVHVAANTATVILPSAGRRVWADGGRSPGGDSALQLLLADEFGGSEGDIHLIHYRGRSVSGATFPGNGGARVAWRAPRSSSGSTTSAKPRKRERPPASSTRSTSESSKPKRSSRPPTTRAKERRPEEPEAEDEQAEEETQESPAPAGRRQGLRSAKPRARTSAAEPSEAQPEEEPPEEAQAEETATEETLASEDEQPAEAQEEDSEPSASEDELGRPSSQALETRKKTGKQRRFRITLALGYQFSAPFSYALAQLDFSATIWGPIQVGVFVAPSYGGQASFPVSEGEDAIEGPLFFVPLGVWAGVRKHGWLSPYVGLAFQYAYNRDGLTAGLSMIGGVVQGGLDISPADSVLVIRIQGAAGLLGLHFNARVGAGVGVRF